jgi:hypothetical protein
MDIPAGVTVHDQLQGVGQRYYVQKKVDFLALWGRYNELSISMFAGHSKQLCGQQQEFGEKELFRRCQGP